MAGWTADELTAIEGTEELDLESERADGSLRDPVTMWVVRHGDDLYVRPVRGREGWFQGTRTRHRGRVRSGGVTRDVAFVDAGAAADAALNETLDDAYRSKYRAYPDRIVGSVVTAEARDATIRLVPAEPDR